MTGTTRRIMAAISLAACRWAGAGDELDRLAENLNAMLERIEAADDEAEGSSDTSPMT